MALASGTATRALKLALVVGTLLTTINQGDAAALEDAVVAAEIANEIKVFCEAGVLEHAPGIAADREYAPGFDVVVAVQTEPLRAVGHGAPVYHRLTVILAVIFQPFQLEQPVGGREEADVAQLCRQRRVGDLQRPVFHQPRVGEALAFGELQEIVPVQRAAQALAI